ncbi:hypothetical protein PCANC_03079 [Puccinia coronata f. sp. avenae]|uniref:Uncharacterized protein n=1 Tax=Puccinia coronata f. sp. avenae TaxID=200324 RepID=A0A2N5W4S2_9BASI|nr:hypothetical protein PCANC_03079 [Puccinia coronata f. sp. avenae]
MAPRSSPPTAPTSTTGLTRSARQPALLPPSIVPPLPRIACFSGNMGSSKRNTARLNSTLSASTKPSKPSNRHLLTGSILSSSSNKSSRSNKPSNSNTTSTHSSLANTTLILPSSAPSPISPSDTTSPLSSSSTTPHPTLSFGNLTMWPSLSLSNPSSSS